MHPLFVAHLVADFLLQPTWLVKWKEKSHRGIILHAGIHGLLSALLFVPRTLDAAVLIAASAALHGYIDVAKIFYQKNRHISYAAAFILDQCTHLVILTAVAWLLPAPYPLWFTPEGVFISAVILTFTFGVAWFNIARKMQTRRESLVRLGIILLSFSAFTTAALLFAARQCASY